VTPVEIVLDPALTPAQNAEVLFRRARKAGRKAEAAFLEDPRRVISADEFLRMKILAEDCLRSVEMGEVRGVGSDTLSALRESLRKNRDFLEGFTQI